ncbi:MAG: hypothetical protein ACUVRU_10350 [Anaerolineae bacterium]
MARKASNVDHDAGAIHLDEIMRLEQRRKLSDSAHEKVFQVVVVDVTGVYQQQFIGAAAQHKIDDEICV